MRTPLQKGEKILLVTYTSWISLVGPTLLMIIGFVGAWFLRNADTIWWSVGVALLGIIIFLYKYFEWRVTIWVVTNYRVIDEAGLLNHFAKESPLEKINNVSYDQTLWGRLMNYGHVKIQTAAEVGATDYFNVQAPKLLKDTITAAQSEHQNMQYGNQAVQMASALGIRGTSQTSIASELEKLFELKQKGILSEDEYNRAKSKLIN
jgi:uncharacterized membrane protein YdbT with pleckstrin-like domain